MDGFISEIQTAICMQLIQERENKNGSSAHLVLHLITTRLVLIEKRSLVLSLLKAMHKGTEHVGKLPQRAHRAMELNDKMRELAQNLEKAVAEENYETAASLRDEIRMDVRGVLWLVITGWRGRARSAGAVRSARNRCNESASRPPAPDRPG